MDEFTLRRAAQLIADHKAKHGRDIAESELTAQGIEPAVIDRLVRRGVVDKYQVTIGNGSRVNRFKLHKDWKTLNKP